MRGFDFICFENCISLCILFSSTSCVMAVNETQQEMDLFTLEDKHLKIVAIVSYVLISVFGIAGNELVLTVVVSVPALRNIANQSLADLVSFILLSSSFLLPPIYMSGIGYSHNRLASFICVIWQSRFLPWASLKVSTANLVVLTLERFLAVVYPYTYRERINLRRAVTLSLSVWVIGLLVKIPWASLYSVSDGICKHGERSEFSTYFFAWFVFLFTVIIPCSLMVFVYISILRKLQHKRRQVDVIGPAMPTFLTGNTTAETMRHRQASERNDTTEQLMRRRSLKQRARRNIMVTMLTVCLFYTVCITPNQVYFFLVNVGAPQKLPNILHVATVLLYSANMCINPFIYSCKYKKLQMGFRVLFCKSRSQLIIQ
ncbi:beta-1 adrenergic receptor-like [Apostichopus japonicus]|uniref:beta-1 adrenergic receptor-like n=1 Tax=Stichopus japonicus TaxID=307972 RepID=UPI003AB1C01C